MTPEAFFDPKGPTVDIALSLSKVDFFNLLGRLFLSYTSPVNEFNHTEGKSRFLLLQQLLSLI